MFISCRIKFLLLFCFIVVYDLIGGVSTNKRKVNEELESFTLSAAQQLKQRKHKNFSRNRRRSEDADKAQSNESFNPFIETQFDADYPVHNLCSPWSSGRQTSELEWFALGWAL